MDSNFYYKRPNILTLTDISLDDYISFEEAVEKKMYNDEDKIENKNIIYSYNKIPQLFTTLNDWITNTNLNCWSCTFTFNTVPKFIPIYIREINDSVEIGVFGNMCSFNCAELWIETHYSSREEMRKLQNNLYYLYYLFTGKRISFIKPALCKTNLLQYGGSMNEEEFIQHMKELENNIS